ncbi:MAG: hypothetical protein DDG59_03220, partial [Anaerolineae bacterium]
SAGFYDFQFALYDAESNGSLLWSEVQEQIEVTAGNFNVFLGSGVPLPEGIFARQELWLEVAVRQSGETEFAYLSPRQRFSAPSNAQSIDGPAQSNSLSCEHTHFGESWSGTGLAGLLIHTPSGNLGGALYGKTGGIGYGVVGQQDVTSSIAGGGVAGFSDSASGYAGYFENNGGGIGVSAKSNTNYGIRGESGSGVGVFGKSNSHDGIRGESAGTGKSGVYGYNSQNGYGVFGRSTNDFGIGAVGVDATPYDTLGDLWLGGDYGEIYAEGYMDLFSNRDIFLDLDDDNNESNACFKIFNGGNSVISQTCENGTKSAVLQTRDYEQRAVYVIESPEVWLQDFGTATLQDGQVTVTFETIFAQTINTELDYHVQLTPLCQEPLILFVVAKNKNGFTVKGVGLDGSPSSCSFDYSVTAKRLGVEELRLEEVSTER